MRRFISARDGGNPPFSELGAGLVWLDPNNKKMDTTIAERTTVQQVKTWENDENNNNNNNSATYRTAITGSWIGAVTGENASGRRRRRCCRQWGRRRRRILNIQQSHVALTVVTDPVSQTLKVDF